MTRNRPIGFLATAAASLVALAVAGCGSSNDNTSAAAPAMQRTGHSSPTVSLASTPLGKILVDSQGRTLYLWQKDAGTKSACSGACAAAWPPLRVAGKPTVGAGLAAAKIGTTARSDGKRQVTYNGHPLYGFAGDTKAGQTSGQGSTGFGAPWYVLSASGNAITAAPSSSGGGNGGY